ncbi:MAG: restriction endonuclease subunit R, partial [Chloroflexi bacterium]
MALLYTEHLLHRVFTDTDVFVEELNELVVRRNDQERLDEFALFVPADLTKLAYWMATGSGKTLLLHLNYHQIRHYLTQARQKPFENILLITPNAGLSQQHLAEFALSDIPAQPFRQDARNILEGTVQIIEITKFTSGRSGPQTVNVGHFEGHNLIFVDEGHRGASGDVWLSYRDQLA